MTSVCNEYLLPANIENWQVITDDGIENCGIENVSKTENKYPLLTHLIAHKNIDFSNSMIEYIKKRIKYDYLYRQNIIDIEDLTKQFPKFDKDYNNRPNNIFNGVSNYEVLNGKDFKSMNFTTQIASAKKERIAENKKIKCCAGSF